MDTDNAFETLIELLSTPVLILFDEQENVLYGIAYLGLGLALLSLIVAFIKSKHFINK